MSFYNQTIFLIFPGAVAYVHGASIIIDNGEPAGTPLVGTNGVADFTWRYDSQTLTGSQPPNMWNTLTGAGVCGTGVSQSPINIVANDAKAATGADIGAVTTTLFDTDLTGALANTGRVLRWMHLGTAKPTISGGPLDNAKT